MAEEKDELFDKLKRPLPVHNVKQTLEEAKAALERAAAVSKEAIQPKQGVVVVRSLRVRKEHNTTSEVVAGLVNGNEVTVYETWNDGKDTWARIGVDQWAAMVYAGETYIKLAE